MQSSNFFLYLSSATFNPNKLQENMTRIKFLSILPFTAFKCFVLFGQSSNDVLNYSAKAIYMVQTDKASGHELDRKALGKDVWISNDTIFKSYVILYTDEDGTSSSLALKYVSDVSFNNDYKTIKMKDGNGNFYYMVDFLRQVGKLKLLDPTDRGSIVVWIVVEGAIKKN
jgi:hypothetical protein